MFGCYSCIDLNRLIVVIVVRVIILVLLWLFLVLLLGFILGIGAPIGGVVVLFVVFDVTTVVY